MRRWAIKTVDPATFYTLGITLAFIGVIILVIAALLIFVSNSKRKGKIRGGGAVIIGPVPIIFGTDKKSIKTILLLSVALMILLIILTVLSHLFSK